ncbi:protein kinase, putative [Trypanosoma cruzi marinkellei]|uniref:non-specific serine/threonine protein kinase n=1 Tax=Trypanosoma cruzi marinkellei TaxID=85056 RepID=K2P9A7_TRYCR|nr:protein kinase, putative [Trypanosoma cruzi marinkellei]
MPVACQFFGEGVFFVLHCGRGGEGIGVMATHTSVPPRLDTKWLEVWRTVSESTTGNLGFSCTLEPLMDQLWWTREKNMRDIYGGGGERAARLLATGMDIGADNGTVGAILAQVRGCSEVRSVAVDKTPTSRALFSGRDEATPIKSTHDEKEGELLSVPHIDGFPAIIRQREAQAALAVARDGSRRYRWRMVRCDSDERQDDQGNEDGEGPAAMPVGDKNECSKSSGGCSYPGCSHSRDIFSDEGDKECSETGERTVEGEHNFGKEGHLACVPGDVLHNRFALICQLGCGCSSRVWLAVDLVQCSVSRRQLMRNLDEHQLCMHFSSLVQPLFVAIKVFRCGLMYEERAESEALLLAYIREFKKAEWLQRQFYLPRFNVESSEISTLNASTAPIANVSSAMFSGQSRSSESDSQSSGEWIAQSCGVCRVSSMRDQFSHRGAFGVHHCIVLDVMGVSLDTFMDGRRPEGIPASSVSSIIRSVLEDLASLAKMHIAHTDIRPASIFLMQREGHVANGEKTFITQNLGSSVLTGSNLKEPRGRASNLHSSRTEVVERPTVPLPPFLKDIVDTPRTGRCQSAHGDSFQSLSEASLWCARVNPLHAVQLSNFDHSIILSTPLRRSHDNSRKSDLGNDSDLTELTEEGAKHTANPHSRPVGGGVLTPDMPGMNTPDGKERVSVFTLSCQFAASLRMSSPSACETSLVDELKRDILARRSYKRGVLLQSREYRSPEIILGKDYNATMDIWSVACTAYELLFDRRLFDPIRDFTAALEREKREGGANRKEVEKNLSSVGEIHKSNAIETTPVESVNERNARNLWFHAVCFNEHEKNIDVFHLRRMVLLLGPPTPRYILSTPMGEYVREFFDAHGRFIFLTKYEQIQLYCTDDTCEAHSYCFSSCVARDVANNFPATAHKHKSAGVPANETNSRRRDSAAHCCFRGVTSAWLRLREQIQARLGKEEGVAFEDFLRRCLQWDPEERPNAHALLRTPWVAAAQDAIFGSAE